ncbi:MAG: TolC family protein [candidate division KSB1 bacterium]|nr:TolC family protein [candidate division KSB1 bacterium]MDZ7346472.1 TolC family protein [candidate division KSB1 bacterium]
MKHSVWAIVLIGFFGMASAEEELVLTIEKSVELAMANNPAYQMKLKEVRKAKAAVVEAYSNLLPQVNATASLQHAWAIQQTTIPNFIKFMLGENFPGASMMPDYVRISFGLENTFVYGASLTQPLFLGGAGWAGVQISRAAAEAAEQSLEATAQSLRYQTAAAFYGCLLAQEVAHVRKQALEEAQKNLDIVRKKYEAGAASRFDVMRAEVNLANLKPEAISARNNLQNVMTLLKMTLALPMETPIRLEGHLSFAEDEFTGLALEEYQRMALQFRPEIKVLDQSKYMAHKGITAARSAFLPKVFFQTDYSYMAMRNDMKFAQKDFSKGFTSAVAVQLPLFTGFKSIAQYQKAQIDYRVVLDTKKQSEDGIAAEVEAAYHKLIEAKERYASANETVHLAEESFRLAGMMYEEGANTQLDVFTAQLGLTSARLNYLSSLYDYQMARYALRLATGRLKEIL